MSALLFLLGGSPAAYPLYANEFVSAAGGKHATMAVLAQSQSGWEKYKEEITRPWVERGVSRFLPIVPGTHGTLDLPSAQRALQEASGIFIGGGNTPTYQRLFATDPLKSLIRQRHQAGIPVAGISAGALISMEICQLVQEETGKAALELVPGLGLTGGFILGVHFSEWNALAETLEVMRQSKTYLAYGIDEPAYIVCQDGLFSHTQGQAIHRIRMGTPQAADYTIETLTPNQPYLRDVIPSDLPIFFSHQQEPQAVQMAAFTAKDPTDRTAFDLHWQKITKDANVFIQTILIQNQVAGSVLSYGSPEETEVSYWIGSQYWGQGIATQALQQFLLLQTIRPIFARAAKDNLASLRVLQKCGFTILSQGKGFANARGMEIEEYLLRLE